MAINGGFKNIRAVLNFISLSDWYKKKSFICHNINLVNTHCCDSLKPFRQTKFTNRNNHMTQTMKIPPPGGATQDYTSFFKAVMSNFEFPVALSHMKVCTRQFLTLDCCLDGVLTAKPLSFLKPS